MGRGTGNNDFCRDLNNSARHAMEIIQMAARRLPWHADMVTKTPLRTAKEKDSDGDSPMPDADDDADTRFSEESSGRDENGETGGGMYGWIFMVFHEPIPD